MEMMMLWTFAKQDPMLAFVSLGLAVLVMALLLWGGRRGLHARRNRIRQEEAARELDAIIQQSNTQGADGEQRGPGNGRFRPSRGKKYHQRRNGRIRRQKKRRAKAKAAKAQRRKARQALKPHAKATARRHRRRARARAPYDFWESQHRPVQCLDCESTVRADQATRVHFDPSSREVTQDPQGESYICMMCEVATKEVDEDALRASLDQFHASL